MRLPEWQSKALKYSTKAAVKAAERAALADEIVAAPKSKKSKHKDGEDRRTKSMKKLFGERRKYKKRLGLVAGSKRKKIYQFVGIELDTKMKKKTDFFARFQLLLF